MCIRFPELCGMLMISSEILANNFAMTFWHVLVVCSFLLLFWTKIY
jgi:hypothetical protein